MPIKKFRDVSEIEEVIYEAGSERLYEVIRHVWGLSDRICPLRFPPGVYKHRTVEEAEVLREEWEAENFRRHQSRRR